MKSASTQIHSKRFRWFVSPSVLLLGIFLFLGASSSWAQSGFLAADLHRLKSVGGVQVSPNGARVLYTEQQRDGARGARSSLRVLNRETGEHRIFRRSGAGGSSALWSPQGDKVALIGPHDGDYGLLVTDADGSNERFIAPVSWTNHPLPSSGSRVSWAPDGKSLAFVSATEGPEAAEAQGDPVVIRRYLYKPTASEGMTRFNDNRRVHLFLAELSSGDITQLTDGPYYEHSIDFSPSGEEILFVSNRESDPDRFFNYDIFSLRLADRSIRRLTRTENAEYRPKFSPDGRHIVYQGTTRGLTSSETTMEDTHVWIMSADGDSRRELVAEDNRQGAPQWSPDGQHVYFTLQERGSVGLYRVGITEGSAEPVVQSPGTIRGFSFGGDGALALVFHGPNDMAQIYGSDEVGKAVSVGEMEALTDSNRALLDVRRVAETVAVDYVSFDGTPVQAYLTLPLRGRDAQGLKHPMIVKIKGGPHGQRGPAFDHRAQVFAAQGWATLQVNYRGSTGYGQAFSDAIFGDQNGGEAKDVVYGVQAALRRYEFLDPERLGIEGGSYGGQLTNWIVTQTDMFRAAIPIAGISNLISFNYMAYYHDYLAVEYGAYPHQGDLMDRLWEASPLKHVAKVRTPVMLVHGENDNDVPIAEAEQFYIALHDVGVEAVMVRYPREGHGIRETGHTVDLIDRSVEWYAEHFFDDDLDRERLVYSAGTATTEPN